MEKKRQFGKPLFVWMFVLLLGGFGAWNLIKEQNAYSMSERRPLAQKPKITWESLLDGTFMADFEAFTQDQFAGRETFRSIKAAAELYGFQKLDNNGIYEAEGYISAVQYPMNEDSIVNAAEKFRQIKEQYFTEENHAYLAVVPDKNYFLAEKNGYLSMNYDQFFDQMEEETPFLTFLDLRDYLELEDYYRTDTHWRQEKIEDVAEYLADEMKQNPTVEQGNLLEESDIAVERSNLSRNESGSATEPQDAVLEPVLVNDSFYGVYAGQFALPVQPDQLYYLDSPLLQQCVVYDYQNDREINVYNLDLASGKDPYQMYLSGDISLLTIENPKGQTGKELILFRDSFGSSLAPLLMEYYDKITLVDIRYLPSGRLDKYIEFTDQDVLFLYSTLVLNHSDTLR